MSDPNTMGLELDMLPVQGQRLADAQPGGSNQQDQRLLWDINVHEMLAADGERGAVCVEVSVAPGEVPRVLWRGLSGKAWRIPHDWRRRRIRLPGCEGLLRNCLPPDIAGELGGRIVAVNYHPGSLCCLRDAYRVRDGRGGKWPVRAADCVVVGFGDEAERYAYRGSLFRKPVLRTRRLGGGHPSCPANLNNAFASKLSSAEGLHSLRTHSRRTFSVVSRKGTMPPMPWSVPSGFSRYVSASKRLANRMRRRYGKLKAGFREGTHRNCLGL